MTAFSSKGRHEKLAIAVNVLQNTYDFVISRCCFAEDGKEMHKDSVQNARAEPFPYTLNLLFGDVLVAVVVVVC